MMAKQKKNTKKPITCIVIMILCLLSGIDDISGFWQPLNVSVTVIQSGSSQDDDDGDHCVKVEYNNPPWRDTIDVAQQLSFSQAYFEEIRWQVNLIYLNSSHNRAPPFFS